MNILLFGATGMVGQGVLRECLLDPKVDAVTTVVRATTKPQDAKIREILLPDFSAVETIADQVRGCDACLYCAGVSVAGLTEEQYSQVNYDLPLKIATLLARVKPAMTFIYVSGAGTDRSERGLFMWARVKGRTENALLRLPFKAAYMFRPGLIQPLHGIQSKTAWYRMFYAMTAPIYPLLLRLMPGLITTTEQLGRAMLLVAQRGWKNPIVESADINQIR